MTAVRSSRRVALAIATVAIAAGCGSSSQPTASASSPYAKALKYSDCMRTRGAPTFPDPSPNGGLLIHGGPGSQLDPSSPAFQSAQQACAKLVPGGAGRAGGVPAKFKQQALKVAACMRTHGVPGFPDPVFSGNGVRIQLKPGVNPSSPAFQAAQKACGSPLPRGKISSVGGPG